MINFVSNLPSGLKSGGFSGMNAAALAALKKIDDVRYAGPVDPPVVWHEKALSKLLRTTGAPGDFFFYSERRLKRSAASAAAACDPSARLDFFHGFTPWILTSPPRPYAAWSDCTFRDYVGIYHGRDRFRSVDLERIENAEAAWLKNAGRVMFTTRWAADRAVRDYALDPGRVRVAGIFGEIDAPAQDSYAGKKEFVFIATNFGAKGGPTVFAAFRELKRSEPAVTLTVVGDRPQGDVPDGVTYAGFLRKEDPADLARLRGILSGARALLHPTKSDIAPLVIIEAGYFGCPAISARKFAIPEIVEDGKSGLLLDEAQDAHKLAEAMAWTFKDEDAYRRMRASARDRAGTAHSKAAFEERLLSCVRELAPSEKEMNR